uniref:Uncharacterized protein n=1 Tax=Hyaloperonospora arabidopsidis (strain Emoy2) TaxID=559515 RepID=M4B3U5_HYAAE
MASSGQNSGSDLAQNSSVQSSTGRKYEPGFGRERVLRALVSPGQVRSTMSLP